jgi:hypothetical protein
VTCSLMNLDNTLGRLDTECFCGAEMLVKGLSGVFNVRNALVLRVGMSRRKTPSARHNRGPNRGSAATTRRPTSFSPGRTCTAPSTSFSGSQPSHASLPTHASPPSQASISHASPSPYSATVLPLTPLCAPARPATPPRNTQL